MVNKNIMAMWLMSPMLGIAIAGAAYILFLFRDKTYYLAIPFLAFVIGIVLLRESKWDKKIEGDNESDE